MRLNPPHALGLLVVVLAGAAWGTGMTAATLSLAARREPVQLPAFLALGSLVLVIANLPAWFWIFILVPAYYGATTAFAWRARRSQAAAAAGTLLYGLLLAGPILGATRHLWSDLPSLEPRFELGATRDAAYDEAWRFTGTFFGILAWHAFVWWRLGRFWFSGNRPPAVRWCAGWYAGVTFGAVLVWCALAVPHRGAPIAGIFALGPLVFLEALIRPFPRFGHVVAGAAAYGLFGFLIAAARDRPWAFWFAAVGWVGFAIGTLVTFAVILIDSLGRLPQLLEAAVKAALEMPAFFVAATAGYFAWHVIVLDQLWKSWSGQSGDRQSG